MSEFEEIMNKHSLQTEKQFFNGDIISDVSNIIASARDTVYFTINSTIVYTYWLVGETNYRGRTKWQCSC